LAILTNTTAFIVAMNIDTQLLSFNLLIVFAILGMTIALARLTNELIALLIWSPLLLDEAGTTSLTLISARVVRTAAYQLIWHGRVRFIAHLGMSIAHTTTPDRNVSDTVEILFARK
jgi:hypothetical protein